MNACLTTTGLKRQFPRLFGVLVLFLFLFLFSCQMAAHAAPADVDKKMQRTIASANHADAGIELALLNLGAYPYALPANSGKQTVQFSVLVRLARANKTPVTVFLRRQGDKQSIAMNDLGKNGDYVAKDGVHGVSVQINTSKIEPDTCLVYEVFTKKTRAELVSSALRLCVSSFPVRVATPNVDKPVVLPDGVKAVADEVLLYAKPTTSAATIRELAKSINAKVVGSIIPLNLYQLRLPSPVSTKRLLEIVAQLNTHAEIAGAAVNPLGQPAGHVDNTTDPEFDNQDGVKLVLKHPTLAGIYVWDAGATGTGQTVVVADDGLDPTHPEFGISGDCQLSTVPGTGVVITDCGGTLNDNAVPGILQWHGTRVAGVIAAKAHNGKGIAGVAHDSKIYSYKVASYALADLDQLFYEVAPYVSAGASIINASFSGGPWNPSAVGYKLNIDSLCAAIDWAVTRGTGSIAVIAAGNNGANNFYYPAQCNQHPNVTLKSRIIAVGNSTSADNLPNCGSVLKDQRCAAAIPANANLPGSNYGAWVDIMAPGSDIRTTTKVGAGDGVGNNYAYSTGTSFSAPIVAGAVAILKSCGVLLDSIKSTLINSAAVNVPYPNNILPTGQTPRLDVYSALSSVNQAPTGITYTPNIVNENSVTPLEAGTLTATDTDTCDKYTFSIVPKPGDDSASFNISGNKLNFNPGVILDAEVKSSYTVTVHVVDFFGAVPPVDTTLTVTINDVNEFSVGPVTDSNAAPNSVAENSAPGTAVGLTASASDADATTHTITYSLTDNAGGRFAINSSTGEVTVIGAIDREAAASYNITVRAMSADTSFTDQVFTINIGDVDEFNVGAVTDSNAAPNSVPENSLPNTSVGLTATASDADATTNTITYSLTDNAGGRFTINGITGVVTVAAGAVLNFEALTSHSITVLASSSDGSSSSQSFTIAVTNMNDAPTGKPVISPPDVSGNRTPPQQLTALTNLILDEDGLGPFHYEWWRDTTHVGTDDVHYTLISPDDLGGHMKVCVSYTDAKGTLENGPTLCSNSDSTAVGDPHIFTVDGLRYDFQGAGEFVALRGDNGMEIQLRMAAVSTAPPLPDDYTGLTSGVSVNTAVAARVGKYRVTYQPDTSANAAAGTFVLRVEGKPVTPPADGIDLGDGGRVLPLSGGGIQIDFPDQTTLMVSAPSYTFYGAWWLHINVFHTPAYEGLMGARSKGSWLPRLSDGSAFGAKPAALHDRYVELYGKFADSWRVNKETTLFDYDKDTSTATFTNKKWPTENGPYVVGNGPVAKPLDLKAAQLACKDVLGKNENANCVFDVRVMGQADLANGHLLHQRIRLGATNIIVRGADKLNARGELVVTATVARHATVVPKVKGIRAVPAGTIQFMLGDKQLGKPLKLDAKGQAKLVVTRQDLERFNGKQAISARFLPAKGKDDVFLPSISRQLTRELKPAVVEGRVKK